MTRSLEIVIGNLDNTGVCVLADTLKAYLKTTLDNNTNL
jgi:hypothetical protein